MVALYPEKMVTIITNDTMEQPLVEAFRRYGVSGYTVLQARGEGASGVSADMTGFDANILVKVVLPESSLQRLLEKLQRMIAKGYHLTVFVSDVQVINPDKFAAHMQD